VYGLGDLVRVLTKARYSCLLQCPDRRLIILMIYLSVKGYIFWDITPRSPLSQPTFRRIISSPSLGSKNKPGGRCGLFNDAVTS
jgi:hypothetical protein